jgi:hypothetical protein
MGVEAVTGIPAPMKLSWCTDEAVTRLSNHEGGKINCLKFVTSL